MRGLDEEEVREYLDLLADQVQASDLERQDMLADNQRLRGEVERLRAQQPTDGEISPQAVLLFSQAQEIADQLVEEAVVHARDLMTSARNQQREILEEAHRAAEAAARQAGEHYGQSVASAAAGSAALDYSTPVPEIEYVRTFAKVAQVQLRSVLDALTEQVEKLGDVPSVGQEGRTWFSQETTTRVGGEHSWRMEPLSPQRRYDQ